MTRKRKIQFKDDPANLKRFRDEIMHLSEPKTKDSNVELYKHDKSEFSLRGKKKLPRKMKRKEERHMKKARKLAHYQGKQVHYTLSKGRHEVSRMGPDPKILG